MAARRSAEVNPAENSSRVLRSKKNRFILLEAWLESQRPHYRYRGREITAADILYIGELIAANPGASRRTLSKKLCEAWEWRQPNGALRDMVCRGMLLMLDRAGQIVLPPVSYVRHNPLAQRARPAPMLLDTTPITDRLRNLQPLEFQQVRRTSDEPLFNGLMEEHHYLGYEQPVGEHLKYLVWAQGRPVACLAWSSAPRHIGSRDRYIGWSSEARRRNIRFLAYNTRFLILPWVRVEHLASHILGRMAARISADWEADVRSRDLFSGDLRGSGAIPWNLLPGGELATARAHHGPRQGRPDGPAEPIDQGGAGLCGASALPPTAERVNEMKPAIERIDLGTEELNQLLERARELLSEEDYRKLKAAVDTLEYLTELVADKDTTIRHLRQLLLPAEHREDQGRARQGWCGSGESCDGEQGGRWPGAAQRRGANRARAQQRRCLHWSGEGERSASVFEAR